MIMNLDSDFFCYMALNNVICKTNPLQTPLFVLVVLQSEPDPKSLRALSDLLW